ncbi:DUF320 domain-containing protein [Nonomuraea sp. FMUSA5-5]|uniref:DUF320 domain-containing protein n=2 Tax=Nonomuraea composti TaxID=2720023 RepID=A0ABX1BIJ9_9ACTN|nr:DUF320 domain-containing protein [Nonomuraea sp. FMUSA5-5]
MMSLAAPAHADITTSGNGSVLGGNQLVVPVNVPVNACGIAVPVVGVGVAGCKGGAAVNGPRHY